MKKLITLFTILLFISCKENNETPDPCDNLCKNNAPCVDGACDCPLGLEGEFCENYAYLKFEGTYDVYDTGYVEMKSWGSVVVSEVIDTHHISTIYLRKYKADDIRELVVSNYFGDSTNVYVWLGGGRNQLDNNSIEFASTDKPLMPYKNVDAISYDDYHRPYGKINGDTVIIYHDEYTVSWQSEEKKSWWKTTMVKKH